jgi:type IV secretory pathway TrbD component
MGTVAAIVGITSGFALLGHHETPANLIATSLAVDASLAPLTAVIAARRGRSPTLWAVAGFAFGMWSLAYVLLVRARKHSDYPPPSEAA